MPTIFDYVNAKEIAVYIKNKVENTMPYLGLTLFPRDKRVGLDLSWFKGSRGLPVALKNAAFDAHAPLRDRIGFERVETEMPFFREGMRIGEKERQEILKLMNGNNVQMLLPFLNEIYDDVANLVAGAEVNAERMRMQLLASGTISIVANGVAYDYDYQMDPNHKETLTGDARWSQVDTADPIEDIRQAQDTIEEDTGTRPTRAICRRNVWHYLLKNKKILLDMEAKGYVGNTNAVVNDSLLKKYLLEELGLTVAVYEKKFRAEVGGETLAYFPEDTFTLIPTGTLGKTWYGTTPEEADLMTGQSGAMVEIVETGVAITTIKNPHPVNVETIVSAIMLPSFETIDEVYILKVHSE